MRAGTFDRRQMPLRQKLGEIHWFLVLLLALIASVGFAMLYSAAGGSLDPWASRQMARFAAGTALLIAIAVTDIRFWFKYAYGIYAVALALLIWVEIAGRIGMGAQRWLSFWIFNFQPSELMKVALLLALAHYFHGGTSEDVRRPLFLIVPVVIVLLPVGLVLRQPDLGTAMMLLLSAAALFFVAGVRIWKFVAIGLTALDGARSMAGTAGAPVASTVSTRAPAAFQISTRRTVADVRVVRCARAAAAVAAAG